MEARAIGYKDLAAMSDEELAKRLKLVRHTIGIIRENRKGCPHYFAHDAVRAEWNRNLYERRVITRILMRRQHAAVETMIDRDATVDAVAG